MVFPENGKQCQNDSNITLSQTTSDSSIQKKHLNSLTDGYPERKKQSERVQRLYKDFLDNL